MSGSGSSRKAHDFLRSIAGFTEANTGPNVEGRPIRLGTVDYDYDPNDFLGGIYPRIMFDGEKVVSQKRYKTMVGYYPLPGHRVVLLPIGTTYLIIGTVSPATQDPKIDIFSTVGSDTWEKPQGARSIRVQVQAGGGAGGGVVATSTSQVCGAGGGAGGGYGESTLLANSVDDSVTVTVGSGGTGGTGTGGNGTSSSFGSYVSATGGPGGGTTGAVGTNAGISGATGASETIVGDIQINGQGGAFGIAAFSAVSAGGMGGNSYLGGGGRGCSAAGALVTGTAGMGYGSGGGGACSGTSANAAANGGDGAPGIVIVTTYF